MTLSVVLGNYGGLSYEVCELMGKPHIGAHYLRDDAKTNRVDDFAQCCICGRLATNSHHVVWLSKCRSINLQTPYGIFVLKSPLFALCGSGTTGCHNGFHGGARYSVEWVWDSDKFKDDWWRGYTLSHTYHAHSRKLFEQGFYLVTDKKTNREMELRW